MALSRGQARALLCAQSVISTPRSLLLVSLACACGASPGVEAELLDAADASSGVEVDLAKLTAFLGPDQDAVVSDPPSSCVTRVAASTNTPAAGQNDYHFAQCLLTGIGVVSVDVRLAYAITGPALHLDLTASSALTIDRTTVASWSASADVTESANVTTVVWQSLASGTTAVRQTPRGFSDDASATLKWSAGSTCLDVDGQIAITFEASDGSQLSYSSTLSSFVACAPPAGSAACPEDGSEVRADLGTGRFIRLRYGANDAASYTNEKGQTFAFVPSCAQ